MVVFNTTLIAVNVIAGTMKAGKITRFNYKFMSVVEPLNGAHTHTLTRAEIKEADIKILDQHTRWRKSLIFYSPELIKSTRIKEGIYMKRT